MPGYSDQTGNKIITDKCPKRIISLVPSQTELLYDLGLDENVIGITKFCIHPEEWFRTKHRVGGTKDLDIEKIRSLLPDLIIANKEENNEEQIKELMKEEFPVWISDIQTLNDALDMISQIGNITGCSEKAETLAKIIKEQFMRIKPFTYQPRCLYLIWNSPFMAAGKNTFIGHMLELCGFENCLKEQHARYPSLREVDIKNYAPDVVLLSSEPYPFKEQHKNTIKQILPKSTVVFVDGEMFSWYGSRLTQAPAYFNQLIEEIHLTLKTC